jgi:hypothetical protein
MRARARSVFWVTGLVGGLVAVLWAQRQPSTKYAEYEIRMVTAMTSTAPSSSAVPMTVASVFFGRADGSKGARTTEIINGRSCTSTTYWNMTTRQEVTASDCLQMKSTMPFVEPRTFLATGLPTCTKRFDENVRFWNVETIHGLKVEKFEQESVDRKAALYFAPDIGCLQVRGAYYWKGPNGEITGSTFDEPVEVKLGNHDPALFSTPSLYREVLPSERRNALSRYFSGQDTAAECLKRGNDREDKRYLEARNQPVMNAIVASVQQRLTAAGWWKPRHVHDQRVVNDDQPVKR